MFQIQVIPAVESPKTAFLTTCERERNRNKNRRLNPDFLGAEDIDFVASDASNYDFYDMDVLKDEFYEVYKEDKASTNLDDLVRLLALRTIEEVCIYCLVFIDEITGEVIGNALQTSREMPRLRAIQIADRIRADKDHADNHLFDPDDETMETIKNIIYSSSDEKLAYLYASSADKKKSTRGRYKASLRETSLFDAMGV